ncbi:MAG: hypothetical protein NZ959_03280 [Armatimonadetes bacterium]|nr:hypothetical protein [Armatimonadota bacterium]MDW8121318.1 hypothetical protein [Armatimonadota bacterium]
MSFEATWKVNSLVSCTIRFEKKPDWIKEPPQSEGWLENQPPYLFDVQSVEVQWNKKDIDWGRLLQVSQAALCTLNGHYSLVESDESDKKALFRTRVVRGCYDEAVVTVGDRISILIRRRLMDQPSRCLSFSVSPDAVLDLLEVLTNSPVSSLQ